MASPTPSESQRHGFFDRTVSRRAAAVVLAATIIFAVTIIIAVPRLLASPEPEPQFAIISKSDWWTKEEIPDGIGGDSVLHVKVAVKNLGDAAGVCGLYVKVEEPGGRYWMRFRFVSISPGETVEEQVEFPEVVDQDVEYSAWLSYP